MPQLVIEDVDSDRLIHAILPFAQAFFRQERFDSLPSNAPLQTEIGNCVYELFASMSPESLEPRLLESPSDVLLNYGHLKELYEALGEKGLLPDIVG